PVPRPPSSTLSPYTTLFRSDQGGAAVYRMPLAVPPGTGGLVPQLAISYNSAAGDGILGTGFVLEGASAITPCRPGVEMGDAGELDRKSTRLNSSHVKISYAV